MVVCFLVFVASVPARADETRLRSRQQFADAMNKIKDGMSTAEVSAVLGPPDDIWTEKQHRAGGSRGQKEVWRYGTSSHTSLATLGASRTYTVLPGRCCSSQRLTSSMTSSGVDVPAVRPMVRAPMNHSGRRSAAALT